MVLIHTIPPSILIGDVNAHSRSVLPCFSVEMCRIGAQELELARNRKETDLDTLIVWTRAHA